ncbi:hypothetical protein ACE41A_13420 [Bacillus cytotoxicus]|uniref:hypothetical protein n=1 Tax=Bacillus cytotoxicus TaxID=580165 RepID=UPI0035CAE048
MKSIKLEEAPKVLQEAVQKHLEAGFEVLEVIEEPRDERDTFYEATLATNDHSTIINLFGYTNVFKEFVVDEQIFDTWLAIKAMKVSEVFRNKIKRHLRTIERKEEE